MMATDYNAIFFPFRLQSGSSFGTRKRYSGDDGLGAVRGREGGGRRKKRRVVLGCEREIRV